MCFFGVQSMVVQCSLLLALASRCYPHCAITSYCGAAIVSDWSWWGPGALKLEAEKGVWPRSCSYFVIQFLYNPESVSLWDRYNIQVCCEAPENQSDFNLQRERCAEIPVCILTVIPGKASSAQEMAHVGTQMRRELGFPIFQKPEGVRISPAADAESMSHMQLPFFFFQIFYPPFSLLQGWNWHSLIPPMHTIFFSFPVE